MTALSNPKIQAGQCCPTGFLRASVLIQPEDQVFTQHYSALGASAAGASAAGAASALGASAAGASDLASAGL